MNNIWYFEEVNLERYGYTPFHLGAIQPALSAGRFFATIPALPYLATARPPCERIYTLGHYRPGSLVPFRPHLIEAAPLPTAVEGLAINGLVFLIP